MRRKHGIRRYGGTRRFRKRRGVWLPTLGTTWGEAPGDYWDAAISFESPDVGFARTQGPTQEVFPLIPDFTFLPSEGSANRAASLHDRVVGNEWKLDRIVGGCHIRCAYSDPEVQDQWPYVQVTAGIFVARSEEGQDSVPDLFSDEYDPQAKDNIQNPWAWRKAWILANPVGTAVRDDFPISNFAYGATDMTDCSVNVKAKRRIRREHRLWFTYSVMGWHGQNVQVPDEGAQPKIQGLLDIRLFGTLINNPKGSSSF